MTLAEGMAAEARGEGSVRFVDGVARWCPGEKPRIVHSRVDLTRSFAEHQSSAVRVREELDRQRADLQRQLDRVTATQAALE